MTADVFVYGTLMRGEPQGALLAHLPRQDAEVGGTLWRMPGGYPALVIESGAGRVEGELVQGVDERLLRLLDRYEGVDEGLFVRQTIEVVVGLRRHGALAWLGVEPARRGGVRLEASRWRGSVRRGRR